jgi:hypothetical protein
VSTHTDLLAAIGTIPDLSGCACIGLWQLYDSSDADDVATAQRICASCSALQACKQWAATQRLTGVVAGQVQQRKPRPKPSPPGPPVSPMRATALAAIAAHEARIARKQ